MRSGTSRRTTVPSDPRLRRLPTEEFRLLRRLWRRTHGRQLPLRTPPTSAEASQISLSLLRTRISSRDSVDVRAWLKLGDDRLRHAPDGTELGPRLRQTLLALLSGDSEKEVAAGLGISPNTVHIYVRRLYGRFGVSTRAELMALWIWPGFRDAARRAAEAGRRGGHP